MKLCVSPFSFAQARAECAMGGKKMLDEGGPPMEHKLQTKANARTVTQSDGSPTPRSLRFKYKDCRGLCWNEKPAIE